MSIFDIPGSPSGTSPGAVTSGQATLVLGTVAINIPGLSATSKATVTPLTPTGSLGATYKAVCTTNTLTITAVTAALATQALDVSVLNYIAIY